MAAVEPGLTPPGAWWLALLAERRDLWNARAAAARARGATTTDLATALREVGAALPDLGPVSRALADAMVPAALDLVVSRRWAATPERASLLAAPGLATHCGGGGEHAAAVVTDLLTATGKVRRWGDVEAWRARLLAAAATPGAADAAGAVGPALLRDLGVLAAWRSGCARLRTAALVTADRAVSGDLPADAVLTALALGRRGEVGPADVLTRHRADPWWWPGLPDVPAPRVAARVGGFRGFGGPWARPPEVLGSIGDTGTVWSVAAAGERWRVVADVHGSAVLRSPVLRSGLPTPLPPHTPLPWDDALTGGAVVGGTALVSRAGSHLLDVLVLR